MPDSKFRAPFLVSLVLFTCRSFGQADGSLLEGVWLREDKQNYQVRIAAEKGVYNGKIIWMKEPLDENGHPRLDSQNPDPDLQNQPLIGLAILKNFQYEGNDKWRDGKIYHFNRGNEYNARIEMLEPDRIKLVISVWFITRTYYWCRVQ